MTAPPVNPIGCGLFLLAAFTLAGVAQTAWFASSASRRFALPLDGGLMLRGQRLFGEHKTVRGFVVMLPASAAAFALLGGIIPRAAGLWDMSAGVYAFAGFVAGLGFMAGELPNSFIKRQLGVAPGAATHGGVACWVQFMADRLDSGIGMLLALTALLPVPWQTWAVVLAAGPSIHWSFSLVMFRLGLKARAA